MRLKYFCKATSMVTSKQSRSLADIRLQLKTGKTRSRNPRPLLREEVQNLEARRNQLQAEMKAKKSRATVHNEAEQNHTPAAATPAAVSDDHFLAEHDQCIGANVAEYRAQFPNTYIPPPRLNLKVSPVLMTIGEKSEMYRDWLRTSTIHLSDMQRGYIRDRSIAEWSAEKPKYIRALKEAAEAPVDERVESQRLLWEPAHTWSQDLVASHYRRSRDPVLSPKKHRITHYQYLGKDIFHLKCHLSNPRVSEKSPSASFWIDHVAILADHSKFLHQIGFNYSQARVSLTKEDVDSSDGYNSHEDKPARSTKRRQPRKITRSGAVMPNSAR